MSEENGNVTSAVGNGEDTQPQVGMLNQYVKDLSIENPNAPASFGWDEQPQIDVQVNIQVNPLNEEINETTLTLSVKSETSEGVQFNVELEYAALFGLRNVPEDQAHPFLYGEAPRLIFPFARRVISDAIRDAGFPPLVLEPIDFNALYIQQRAQAQSLAEEQPAGEA